MGKKYKLDDTKMLNRQQLAEDDDLHNYIRERIKSLKEKEEIKTS